MCIRYFGFFLLICFPGVLHGNAQSAALSCSAPKLDDGYFVPEGDAYAHAAKLVYACDEGYKPVVDGWWAESTCQNGKWSHEPLCIDENACFMPDIRNGKHKQEEKGWYADGSVMEITCDKGYEIKRRNATPTCRNGKWISESVCKKSRQACGEPPKVSHAVVINQGYQDVFAEDSEVQYECEDGFTAETDTKTIICRAGTWTAAPTCSRERIYSTTRRQDEGDTGPLIAQINNCGTPPNVPNGDIVLRSTMFLKYQCNNFYTLVGPDTVTCYSDKTWSTLPICKGRQDEGDTGPLIAQINNCGTPPNVPNGDIVERSTMFLKYQCNNFYTLVGSDTVTCYSDKTWSTLPICKDAFCRIIPDQFDGTGIKPSLREPFMREGETRTIRCKWANYYSTFECTDGKISATQCCHHYAISCGTLPQLFG